MVTNTLWLEPKSAWMNKMATITSFAHRLPDVIPNKECARNDDGEGIREVDVNTVEGMSIDVGNFLRSFKGVHQD